MWSLALYYVNAGVWCSFEQDNLYIYGLKFLCYSSIEPTFTVIPKVGLFSHKENEATCGEAIGFNVGTGVGNEPKVWPRDSEGRTQKEGSSFLPKLDPVTWGENLESLFRGFFPPAGLPGKPWVFRGGQISSRMRSKNLPPSSRIPEGTLDPGGLHLPIREPPLTEDSFWKGGGRDLAKKETFCFPHPTREA